MMTDEELDAITDDEKLERLEEVVRHICTALIWEIDHFATFGSGAKTKSELQQILQRLDGAQPLT